MSIPAVTYQVGPYEVDGNLMLAANVKVAETMYEQNKSLGENQIPNQ